MSDSRALRYTAALTRAFVATACAALLAALVPAAARADLPALSREVRGEEYVDDASHVASVLHRHNAALAFSGGAFMAGDKPGSWNAYDDVKRVAGGTIDADLQFGRWTLGANAIADTWHAVDDREFAQRAYVTAYVPEAHVSLVASAGFGDGRYAGADLTAETLALRWTWLTRGIDLRPRVWAWARVRRLDAEQRTVLTPALAMFVQHAAVIGSQAYVGITGESDMTKNLLPVTRALVQAGWASAPHPIWSTGDPDSPDATSSLISWNWFTALAYARSLDQRDVARTAAQAGVRFTRPIGR